jgi:hypothetical protein
LQTNRDLLREETIHFIFCGNQCGDTGIFFLHELCQLIKFICDFSEIWVLVESMCYGWRAKGSGYNKEEPGKWSLT